ncbi:DUF6204 family protein [Terrabacter sp. NPDC080008]|uniref:DUF6204 family protein n=1 Tax=Terrabacter sp. NPDC080008 TaxID=3155176 RepID=UPI0034504325
MTTRTYRVQVAGQFAGLSPELAAQLRREQADHDVLVSAFTSEGSFTYTSSLTRFTLRYLLELQEGSAAEADEIAPAEGELRAADFLDSRGITHQPLSVSAVCLQDVKPRRR